MADLDQQTNQLAIKFIEKIIGRPPSRRELSKNYIIQGNFGDNFDLSNIIYEHIWKNIVLFVTDKNGKILKNE